MRTANIVWSVLFALAFSACSTAKAIAECSRSNNTDGDCVLSDSIATKTSLYARQLYKQRKYKEAAEAYTQAIQERPRTAALYNNRASAYEKFGEHRRALDDFAMAIMLRPKDDIYLLNRGGLHSRMQNFALAKADLEAALAINPKARSARAHLASVLHSMGESELALSHLNMVIAERSIPALVVGRAMIYRDINRLSEALADLQCAKLPSDSACYTYLADVYRLLGDHQKASAALTAALRIDPNGGGNYRVRGDLKQAKGDLAGALLDYSKAFDLDSSNVLALLRRGDTLMQINREADALNDYDAAARIDQRNARELAFRKEAQQKAGRYRDTVLRELANGPLLIFFDYGLTDIVVTGQPLLERAAQALVKGHAKSVLVTGYVDRAEAKQDPHIGHARALSIKSALVRAGVSAEAIKTAVGVGDALVTTVEGEKEPQNRVVILTFAKE